MDLENDSSILPFSKCNLVLIDNFSNNFKQIFDTPTHETIDSYRYGSTMTFSPSPDLSVSLLPVPYGRGSNYNLQTAILKTADVFLLVLDTTNFDNDWITRLAQDFPGRPVIHWINRGNEESAIKTYQQNQRRGLLRQQATQRLISEAKEKENQTEINSKKYGLNLWNYYPVVSHEKLISDIKSVCSQEPNITEVDLSPLSEVIENETERTEKMRVLKGEFSKVFVVSQQLFQQMGPNVEVEEAKSWPVRRMVTGHEETKIIKTKKKSGWMTGIGKKLGFFSKVK